MSKKQKTPITLDDYCELYDMLGATIVVKKIPFVFGRKNVKLTLNQGQIMQDDYLNWILSIPYTECGMVYLFGNEYIELISEQPSAKTITIPHILPYRKQGN